MKFLKHFFEYVKNIVSKDKTKIEKNNLEQSSNQTPIVEDPKYSYNQIKIGDIIWAKRYNSEDEMELIPEGHREGSFIVLAVQDGNLFCAQGTGIPPYSEYSDSYFYIDDIHYTLRKPTYFNLIKLVSIDSCSFVEKLNELKKSDLNNLYRQIKIMHKLYYTEESKLIRLNMPIQVGDIIRNNNQNYIIINKNESKFLCIHLDDRINFKKSSKIVINNFSNLDYSKIYEIDINGDFKYISSINDNILNYILKEQKNHSKNCAKEQEIQRGSIVLKDNKYYYIYGEEGQEWLAFEIKEKKENDFEEIKLGNRVFYTEYNDQKIDKKDNLINVFVCKDEDRDIIKKSRKHYKEVKRNLEVYGTTEFVYFSIGDIIENINYKNKRFIIIGNNKKTYECLNIQHLQKGIFNPILVRKTDAKLSKNTSIKGIKWLEDHPNFNFKRIGSKEILEQVFQTQKEFIEKKKSLSQKQGTSNMDVVFEQNDPIRLNMLIKTNEFSEETFVVKEIIGDMLVCVSSIDLGRPNPKKHYFNKNNIITVKVKQKRK